MNTSATDTIRVACRHCGMVMTARRDHAGRPAKCPRCEAVIRLDEAPALEHPSGLPAPIPAEKAPEPTTTGVSCRVCGTRMAFELKHVGRKAKCPDCGALTVIPPPAPPPKPNTPQAMEGEQYDVWQGESQPWGVDLARWSPEVLRVPCGVCQTLIDAEPEQVGERVTCPDCGAATVVPPPKEVATRRKPDPARAPSYAVEREESSPPPDASAWLDSAAAPERENEFATQPRPELPRLPMVTGVFGFFGSNGIVARWLALSASLGIGAALAVFATVQLNAAAATNSLGAVGYVLMGATAGLIATIIGFMTLAALAAHAMEIVTETSEGNDLIHQWPIVLPTEWVGELLVMAVAVSVSAAPGWLMGSLAASSAPPLAGLGPVAPAVCALAGVIAFFPIVLLSQLVASSPWALVTFDVLRVLPRVLGAYMLLLLESVGLAALALAAIGMAVAFPPLLLLAAPTLVAVAAVYFRLLGRLAWVIADRG